MKNLKKYTHERFEHECLLNRNLAKPGRHSLIVVLDHLKEDFNVGKILRSCEYFSIHEVHVIGLKFFDPIPAKGALKKVPTKFFATVAESFNNLLERGYQLHSFDLKAETPLQGTELPDKTAIILGHEEFGVTFKSEEWPMVKAVKIPGFGEMQSLNVSVAASIGIYEYARQHPLGPLLGQA